MHKNLRFSYYITILFVDFFRPVGVSIFIIVLALSGNNQSRILHNRYANRLGTYKHAFS